MSDFNKRVANMVYGAQSRGKRLIIQNIVGESIII